MNVVGWIGVIVLTLAVLANFIGMITRHSTRDRAVSFTGLVLGVPAVIYLWYTLV